MSDIDNDLKHLGQDETPMHAHRLQLRKNVWVQLVIPDDITEKEMACLCEWARCLVIEDWLEDEE